MRDTSNLKFALGRLLGEVYLIQDKLGVRQHSKAEIFGLINGLETVIDEALFSDSPVTAEEWTAGIRLLNDIYQSPEKMEKFKGFYDIENALVDVGIGRGEAIKMFTYLKAKGRFTELIEKMDSSNSPSEVRTFDFSEWDFS